MGDIMFRSACAGIFAGLLSLQIAQATPLTEAEKLRLRPLTVNQLPISGVVRPESRIALPPKYEIIKPDQIELTDADIPDHIVLKFVDGSRIRATNPDDLNTQTNDPGILQRRLDALIARVDRMDAYDLHQLERQNLRPDDVARELEQVRALLKSAPLDRWGKMYALSDSFLERIRINADLHWESQTADLAAYYWFKLTEAKDSARLVNALNAFEIVEEVYFHPALSDPQDLPLPTRNMQPNQGYLATASQGGIGAQPLWGIVPGARGNNVAVIDIENDWTVDHEDMPPLDPIDGRVNGGRDAQHGTAAMSVMVAPLNGYGITGIIHEAQGGVVSFNRNLASTYYLNLADAIIFAARNLRVGDVLLIEQQLRSLKLNNATCACGGDPGGCGLLPVEQSNLIFDAIKAASAMGVIVIEPAGNGFQDLDKPRYNGKFNRSVRDSGAIMVGASFAGTDTRALCSSNTGTRVDLHGWGRGVMAAGYGESQNAIDPTLRFGTDPSDQRQWYRSDYNGTSSAGPIVAGAVGAVQSILVERVYPPMNRVEVRDLLAVTGTPQTAGNDITSSLGNIGPRPDLEEAVARLNITHPAPSPSEPEETPPTELAFVTDAQVMRTVAGVEGTRTRRISFRSGLVAVGRLEYGERRNRPCFFRIDAVDFENALPANQIREVTLCGTNGVVPNSRKSVPRKNMVAGREWREVMTGVQVCNSSSRNRFYRMKGLRMHYAFVRPDGTLDINTRSPAEHDRIRCDGDWGRTARCFGNAVVTGLVIHETRDRNSDYALSGLQVICRRIGLQ